MAPVRRDARAGSATRAPMPLAGTGRLGFGALTPACVIVVGLAAGLVLSLATTHVANWFVMTDELLYERLAISVAQTGSWLPQLRGEHVERVGQLYPLLLSPFFGDGDVGSSTEAARRLNALLFASAALPVYLLARGAGAGRLAGTWAAVLSIALPWAVLASFLLSESLAYPACCWALVAIRRATERRTAVADAVALGVIGVAVVARVQLAVLVPALIGAVAIDETVSAMQGGVHGRALALGTLRQLGRRVVLVATVALLGLAAVIAAMTGGADRLFGSYAVTVHDIVPDAGFVVLFAEHAGALALGVAILPFLLAVAWMSASVGPARPPRERAFAAVGLTTIACVALQVTSFDDRFGEGLVKDRYLFYVVPVLLVAVASAMTRARPLPWWSFVAPTLLVVLGLATYGFPVYSKLNVDSVLALLTEALPGDIHEWPMLVLLLGTAVVAALACYVIGTRRPRALALAAAALVTIVLPSQTVASFDRLFSVPGTNGLDVSLDQGAVFGWIDRQLGPNGRVTMIEYPFDGSDWSATSAYWWDVEFWNETVVDSMRGVHGSPDGRGRWIDSFDRNTGLATTTTQSPYVLVHQRDARFRLAGRVVAFDRGSYLVQADLPWRAGFVSAGIDGDGWLAPHAPATITVFPEPGQRTALERFVTVSFTTPANGQGGRVGFTSNLDHASWQVRPGGTVEHLVRVCVPPRGTGTVQIASDAVGTTGPDPTADTQEPAAERSVGGLLNWIAYADEREPRRNCSSEAR